jgi:triosephosphate isomerase
MDRKPIIAGNWKMYKTSQEAVLFIQELAPKVTSAKALVYLAVPFTSIEASCQASKKTNIVIGAQNMHESDKGAFTGEISARMLKMAGCEFVLLGHSERRQFFHETDKLINKKVLMALKEDIQPILCIGETKEQREHKQTHEVLKEQLTKDLLGIPVQEIEKIVIAYEPVWAIGTGLTATPEIAEEAHHFIRHTLSELYDASHAAKVRILYGGSVKPENICDLMKEKDIDGALVGGASLDVSSFEKIINFS